MKMWILLFIVTAFLWGISEQTEECSISNPRSMRLFITSTRNQTGYWNTQLRMDHGDRPGVADEHQTGRWEVDLQQTSNECDGTNTVTIIANVKAPPPRAGSEYEYIPGVGYYKLHTTVATWEDARKTCRQEGAHLLVLESQSEADAVKEFSRYGKIEDAMYIGASDIHTEGQFMTILGRPLSKTGYVKWKMYEPNNKNNIEDCVVVYRSTMMFNDVDCSTKLPFICEQEL